MERHCRVTFAAQLSQRIPSTVDKNNTSPNNMICMVPRFRALHRNLYDNRDDQSFVFCFSPIPPKVENLVILVHLYLEFCIIASRIELFILRAYFFGAMTGPRSVMCMDVHPAVEAADIIPNENIKYWFI